MQFLKDNMGKTSSMRIMSFFSLFASFYFAHLAISLDSQIGLYIVPLFVVGAFAPKAVQKYIELSPNAKKEKNSGQKENQ